MKRQDAKGAKGSSSRASARTPSSTPSFALAAESDENVRYGRTRAELLQRSRSEPDARADALARTVIGAAIAVHRELGPGYPEVIYQRALAHELIALAVPFVREKSFSVHYRGASVGEGQLDFLVDDLLVVELESVEAVLPVHRAQVLGYLKALGLQLGLLINLNAAMLKSGIERVVRT